MAAPLQFHSPQAALLLDMARQIRAYERLSLTEQHALQGIQLHRLLVHAQQYSSFWRQRLTNAGFDPSRADSTILQRLPVLQRSDVQNAAEALRARWPTLREDQLVVSTTSGSTGVPVRVEKLSGPYSLIYAATSLIEGDWHKRDATRRIAVLAPGLKSSSSATWGGSYEALGLRGLSVTRGMHEGTMESHLQWLQEQKPDYLKCGPVAAAELAALALQHGVQIPLRQIISQSERVTERHRALCMQAFGAHIIDRYSCEETGWIALQCPTNHKLHVLNATVLLEIVNEEGAACGPGEVGRVLLTGLHSHAMPLIRYEIGDMAEWGTACGCGLTLPVLERLWGRIRHQISMPDGRLVPMAFLGDELGQIQAIEAFRMLQYRGGEVEIRMQVNGTLSELDRAAIGEVFERNGLGGLRRVIRVVEDMGWGTDRKREEFLRVDAEFAEEVACPST